MANPPCWRVLSEQERAACVGEPRHSTCCSQFAWDVAGDLQTDWNCRVQPRIADLIHNNYKKVHGKKGAHALLLIHLFWLSPTKDSTTAKPTIVIRTVDKKAAANVRKLLLKHDIFKNLDTGFDIVFENKPTFFSMGRAPRRDDSREDYFRADTAQAGAPQGRQTTSLVQRDKKLRALQGSSLCGAPVVATAYHLSLGADWRRATIFCVVSIGTECFAVLPAHIFYPEPDTTGSKDDEDDESDMSSSQSASERSNESQNEDSDNSVLHSGENSSEPEQRLSDTLAEPLSSLHLVYLNPTKTSGNIAVQDLQLLAVLDLNRTPMTTCRALDYALVPISSALAQENNVQDLVGNTTPLVGHASQPRNGSVLLTSGYSPSRQVRMSSTTVTLAFPWSDRPQVVWQIDYSLPPGDSGSLVTSDDGKIIGMAFATAPDLNITYVMPAKDIFDNIQATHTGVTTALTSLESSSSQTLLAMLGQDTALQEESEMLTSSDDRNSDTKQSVPKDTVPHQVLQLHHVPSQHGSQNSQKMIKNAVRSSIEGSSIDAHETVVSDDPSESESERIRNAHGESMITIPPALKNDELATYDKGKAYAPRRNRIIASCLGCRSRKLKCDEIYPCTNCNKFSRECIFPAYTLDSVSQKKLNELRDKMGSLDKMLEDEIAQGGSSRHQSLPERWSPGDLPGEDSGSDSEAAVVRVQPAVTIGESELRQRRSYRRLNSTSDTLKSDDELDAKAHLERKTLEHQRDRFAPKEADVTSDSSTLVSRERKRRSPALESFVPLPPTLPLPEEASSHWLTDEFQDLEVYKGIQHTADHAYAASRDVSRHHLSTEKQLRDSLQQLTAMERRLESQDRAQERLELELAREREELEHTRRQLELEAVKGRELASAEGEQERAQARRGLEIFKREPELDLEFDTRHGERRGEVQLSERQKSTSLEPVVRLALGVPAHVSADRQAKKRELGRREREKRERYNQRMEALAFEAGAAGAAAYFPTKRSKDEELYRHTKQPERRKDQEYGDDAERRPSDPSLTSSQVSDSARLKEGANKWQNKLEEEWRQHGGPVPIYRVISDRRGGRIASTANVTIHNHIFHARSWYDAQYLNNAREDAAEVAYRRLYGDSTPTTGQSLLSHQAELTPWLRGFNDDPGF